MFTLVGYTANVETNNQLTYITPLADQHVRVEGNNIIVPSAFSNLASVYALGASITGARVESPSLRRVLLRDVAVYDKATVPVYVPSLEDMFTNPMGLDPTEPLRFLAREDAAGASRLTGLIWLADGPLTPVGGDIYTVRATAAGVNAPYVWTNVPLDIDQTIPAGTYQVVGLAAYTDNVIAARLVFVGESQRPGCLGAASPAGGPTTLFRRGNLGIWGEFEHSQPPTVDVLTAGVVSAFEFYLDLVKVA